MPREEIRLHLALPDGFGVSGEEPAAAGEPSARPRAGLEAASTYEVAPVRGLFDSLGSPGGGVPPALARLLEPDGDGPEGGAFRVLAGLTVVPELARAPLAAAGERSLSAALYGELGLSSEGVAWLFAGRDGAATSGESVAAALLEQARGLSESVFGPLRPPPLQGSLVPRV